MDKFDFQDIKSELYKTFAAQYLANYTCWECDATGMRLTNPADLRHDKQAPRSPCESCSGGYIPCREDTSAERAAVQFYKEWIACCEVERKFPDECAFQGPELLLLTERYAPHFAYIVQYPRPAIYDQEEWEAFIRSSEDGAPDDLQTVPEAISYIDNSIEGESLCHRWARKGWSPDFIDEDLFLQSAGKEGLDVKAMLSQQDAWGRTPLHFDLPPVGSKLCDLIDSEMLTGIRSMGSDGQCRRFSAHSSYDRYTWSSVSGGFLQGHSAIENYLYTTYLNMISPLLSDSDTEEESRQKIEARKKDWHDQIGRLCGLVKQKQLALNVDIFVALFELDAQATKIQRSADEFFDEVLRSCKGDALAQSHVKMNHEHARSSESHRACLKIIESAGYECFEKQLPAIRSRIRTAEILTYDEGRPDEKVREQLRDLMEEGLNKINDIFDLKRRISAALRGK